VQRLTWEHFIEAREAAFAAAAPEVQELPPVDLALCPQVHPDVGLPVVQGVPSAPVVRAAIAAHGSLVVRGLVSEEAAACLRDVVERSLEARQRLKAKLAPAEPGWYVQFPRLKRPPTRDFTEGVLAVDSPRGLEHLVQEFRKAGIDRLAGGVLGAVPALSAEKTVFREVYPREVARLRQHVDYGWHQDGAFLGEHIGSLDVWIALTGCGRYAPAVEVVAHRFDALIPPGGRYDWDLSRQRIERALPGARTVFPQFEPGDGLIFDQLCAHRSSYLEGMTERRLAIECWFFAPASMPSFYAGLLL
jgi:hypothetical protein